MIIIITVTRCHSRGRDDGTAHGGNGEGDKGFSAGMRRAGDGHGDSGGGLLAAREIRYAMVKQ
jgi:hypothetical protein